jgi:hypothetical protein
MADEGQRTDVEDALAAADEVLSDLRRAVRSVRDPFWVKKCLWELASELRSLRRRLCEVARERGVRP